MDVKSIQKELSLYKATLGDRHNLLRILSEKKPFLITSSHFESRKPVCIDFSYVEVPIKAKLAEIEEWLFHKEKQFSRIEITAAPEDS